MDKSKFKKLALMGITGGIILASQSPVDLNASSGFTVAAGCGKSCGAKKSQNFTADNAGCGAPRAQSWQSRENAGCNAYAPQPQQYSAERAGCSSASQPMQQPMQQPMPYTAERSGCSSYSQPQQQPLSQAGCSSASRPSNSRSYGSETAGCGAAPRNNNSNGRGYTAENAGCAGRNNRSFTADATSDIPTRWPNSQQSTGSNSQQQRNQQGRYIAEATQTRTMSETELKAQLTPDVKATFDGLSSEGKALALKLANQTCQGKNDCKGLNSCKTAENSCAGTGACKGTTPGPFTDKNKAVKVAAKKMAEKRSAMNSGRSN